MKQKEQSDKPNSTDSCSFVNNVESDEGRNSFLMPDMFLFTGNSCLKEVDFVLKWLYTP